MARSVKSVLLAAILAFSSQFAGTSAHAAPGPRVTIGVDRDGTVSLNIAVSGLRGVTLLQIQRHKLGERGWKDVHHRVEAWLDTTYTDSPPVSGRYLYRVRFGGRWIKRLRVNVQTDAPPATVLQSGESRCEQEVLDKLLADINAARTAAGARALEAHPQLSWAGDAIAVGYLRTDYGHVDRDGIIAQSGYNDRNTASYGNRTLTADADALINSLLAGECSRAHALDSNHRYFGAGCVISPAGDVYWGMVFAGVEQEWPAQ